MSEQQRITKEEVERFKMQRAQECGQRLAELLKEYDCDLIATPRIVDGRIVVDVQLVAK